ncbi:hypothetical protein HYALB_00006114 [Hymenoscyphus albidus]|uniref:Uncharacterized protein n=1 Tax=Hymenoscyphus albidus TaxID=595503 RepID=A0A9N9QD34_9HELO|nr:hypothetical protein HYALB_00006114 [Hymenoscyphus albidus]
MAAGVLGERLLREVQGEEGSLEDLLTTLRTHHPSQTTLLPAPLTQLLTHHNQTNPTKTKTLTLSGSYTPLINHLILTLLTPAQPTTIAILDLTHRFSPSHLVSALGVEELRHIHVFYPTPETLRGVMEGLEGYMVDGSHASKGREWRGVFVIGGPPPGVLGVGEGKMGGASMIRSEEMLRVGTSWRGWLRVEREVVKTFGKGISVEEAWEESMGMGMGMGTGRNSEGELRWRAVCGEGVYRF